MNKKTQIIIVNLILLGFCFFVYQKSNLTIQQNLLATTLCILSGNLLFIKNILIKGLALLPTIGFCFLLLLGFLPLYKESPDNTLFYLSQNTQFLFLGNPQNTQITDKTDFGEQKIQPKENQQDIFLGENTTRTISFYENEHISGETNQLIIQFPNNTIYIIFPETQITLKKINTTYEITKESGNVEYYEPTNNKQVIIKNCNANEKKSKSDFSLQYLIKNYENRETKYIIEQGGGTIITRSQYQNLSKKIIDIAYQIRPEIYSTNLENYKQYKAILGRKESQKQYEDNTNRGALFFKQIQKGREESRILK